MDLTKFQEQRKIAAEIFFKYFETCKELFAQAEKEVVRREFARGGKSLIRGYYCPSPVHDLVFGNAARGKLISKPQKEPDFIYGFDAQGRLRTVQRKFEAEVILYKKNCEIGLCFHPNWDFHNLVMINLVEFRAGIKKSWTNFLVCGSNAPGKEPKFEFVEREEYSWDKDLFLTDFYRYTLVSGKGKMLRFDGKTYGPELLERDIYRFQHKNGVLKSYTLERFYHSPARHFFYPTPRSISLERNLFNPIWQLVSTTDKDSSQKTEDSSTRH